MSTLITDKHKLVDLLIANDVLINGGVYHSYAVYVSDEGNEDLSIFYDDNGSILFIADNKDRDFIKVLAERDILFTSGTLLDLKGKIYPLDEQWDNINAVVTLLEDFAEIQLAQAPMEVLMSDVSKNTYNFDDVAISSLLVFRTADLFVRGYANNTTKHVFNTLEGDWGISIPRLLEERLFAPKEDDLEYKILIEVSSFRGCPVQRTNINGVKEPYIIEIPFRYIKLNPKLFVARVGKVKDLDIVTPVGSRSIVEFEITKFIEYITESNKIIEEVLTLIEYICEIENVQRESKIKSNNIIQHDGIYQDNLNRDILEEEIAKILQNYMNFENIGNTITEHKLLLPEINTEVVCEIFERQGVINYINALVYNCDRSVIIEELDKFIGKTIHDLVQDGVIQR